MKYATEKQLKKAVEEKKYKWVGWQMWNAFVTLPKGNKIRSYHSKIWNSLSEEQQKKCEQ